MKLGKFNEALNVAREFGMDGTDVAILFAIAEKRRDQGVATIMQFSSGTDFAAFATIHERVKRMVKAGILRKDVKEDNQRFKILNDGPTLDKFLDKLNSV